MSFFAHEKGSSLDMSAGNEKIDAKTALATNSPGIVAVVIGAIVIIVALSLRGEHVYTPPGQGGQVVSMPPPLDEVFRNRDEGKQDKGETK